MAKISWSWVVAQFQVRHSLHHSLLPCTGPALVIYIICLIPEGICGASPLCMMFWFVSLCSWLHKNKVWRGNRGHKVREGWHILSLLKKTKQNKTTEQDRQEWEVGPKPVTEASSRAYPFHRVIHWHQRLKPFAMQHVCELHVDGQHGSRVLHDPVLIHVWGIVIAGSSEKIQKGVLLCMFSSLREISQGNGCKMII